jgi:hypothetical protein
MSTISKKLSGFMFNGSALALGTAAFKSSLNSVIGFNAAGTGYTSYNPSNAFNSLTQLAQDGVYIVDAKTPGFDIPGAVLTAATSGAGPNSVLSFVTPQMRRSAGSNNDVNCNIEFGIDSTVPDDKIAMIFLYDDFVNGFDYSFNPVAIDINNLYSIDFIRQKGTAITLFATSNNGNTAYKSFVV